MTAGYEYRVIPSPRRAKSVRGAKTGAERLAATLAELLNSEAVEGWEYWRAEVLPADERPGLLKSRVAVAHPLLIFRRPLVKPAAGGAAELLRALPVPADDSPRPSLRALDPAEEAPARLDPVR